MDRSFTHPGSGNCACRSRRRHVAVFAQLLFSLSPMSAQLFAEVARRRRVRSILQQQPARASVGAASGDRRMDSGVCPQAIGVYRGSGVNVGAALDQPLGDLLLLILATARCSRVPPSRGATCKPLPAEFRKDLRFPEPTPLIAPARDRPVLRSKIDRARWSGHAGPYPEKRVAGQGETSRQACFPSEFRT